MPKIKRGKKSKQKQLEDKPKKIAPQAANGKVKAKKKVVNGEQSKDLCAAEVSPAPFQAAKDWVIKSKKQKQEEGDKPKIHVEIKVKHPKAAKRTEPQLNGAGDPPFETLEAPGQHAYRSTFRPQASSWRTLFPPNQNSRFNWNNTYRSVPFLNRSSPSVKYSSHPKRLSKREPLEYKDGKLPKFSQRVFKKIVTYEKVKRVTAALKIQDQTAHDGCYILDVTSFEIMPNYPERLFKLPLKHPLVSKDDGVCLFVRDSNDGEQTKEHFEELLKTKEVSVVKKVIPLNQLKTKYSTSEMQTKLANKYGVFLCDKTIENEISFITPTCKALIVDMDETNLNREISLTMQSSFYKHGHKELGTSIAVGTNKMTIDQVAENIMAVFNGLEIIYGGGYKNIRSMYLKKGTTFLPIYSSLCQPPTFSSDTDKDGDMKKLISDAKNILSKLQTAKNAAGQKRTVVDDDKADATNITVKKSKSNDGDEQGVELLSEIQELIKEEQKSDNEEDVDFDGENEDDGYDDIEDDDDEDDDDEDSD